METQKLTEEVREEEEERSVLEICGSFPIFCFYVTMFTFGAGISVVGNFLFLHLLEDLGASHTLLGLTVLSTIVIEVPVFESSALILRRLGIRGMIIVAHLAYCARVTCYYFLKEAWFVLCVEVLHGLTYALIWPAGVAYASRSVSPVFETTAQGVFSGVFGGIGSAAGALIGGVVYENFGANILFAGSGGVMFLNLFFFLIFYKKPYSQLKRILSTATMPATGAGAGAGGGGVAGPATIIQPTSPTSPAPASNPRQLFLQAETMDT
jgi:predicted MFS family arabinose efflux permease